MDKYELNIKIEKMKKAADRKDYTTAAKVADSLNWEKSTNAKILMLIAQIYEKEERYSDARSALTVVYNRVPVGKRVVYKLAELSIKCGEIDEAMDLYREFQEIAPNDPSKLILAYRISVANGEPIEKQISILEAYNRREFDEKWSYELATLYQQAGRSDDCVALCDEIILWFSVGPYVDKAMTLKTQFAPLSPEQEEKRTNRELYEQKVDEVAAAARKKEIVGNVSEIKSFQRPVNSLTAPAGSDPKVTSDHIMALEQELAQSIQSNAEEQPQPETNQWVTDKPISVDRVGEDVDGQYTLFRTVEEENGTGHAPGQTRTFSFGSMLSKTRRLNSLQELKLSENTNAVDLPEEDEVTVDLPEESEETVDLPEENEESVDLPEENEEAVDLPEEDEEETEILSEENEEEGSDDLPDEENVPVEVEEEAEELSKEEQEETEDLPEENEEEEVSEEFTLNELFEDDTPKEKIFCRFVTLDEDEPLLNQIKAAHEEAHEISGIPSAPVARISVDKINHVGLTATLKKLNGRDLLIDNAGALAPVVLDQLLDAVTQPTCSLVILLADDEDGIEALIDNAPELYAYFCDEEESDEDDELDNITFDLAGFEKSLAEENDDTQNKNDESEESEDDSDKDDDGEDDDEDDEDDDEDDDKTSRKKSKKSENEDEYAGYDTTPLTADEFIRFLHTYAEENDCRLDEMAELALAARVDKMELTRTPMDQKTGAILMDQAIDRAERFTVRSIFFSRYDSEGYLVLKEKHFS